MAEQGNDAKAFLDALFGKKPDPPPVQPPPKGPPCPVCKKPTRQCELVTYGRCEDCSIGASPGCRSSRPAAVRNGSKVPVRKSRPAKHTPE